MVNSNNNNVLNNNPGSMMRKRLVVIMRGSQWYRGYRVDGHLWCYVRVKGKGQAPCGHVMITTVL